MEHLPILCVLLTFVCLVRTEQLCSVCCWESSDDAERTAGKQCRLCVHDQDTCPSKGMIDEPVPLIHPQAAGPPGKTTPSELHAMPAHQYSFQPGSRDRMVSEGLAGPPAGKDRRTGAAPGYKAQGIVLPEGPEDDDRYLTFATRPGTQAGPPAYGHAPAPAAPGWRAFPPGTDQAQELVTSDIENANKITQVAIAFSASTTRRLRATRKPATVSFGSVLTNLDSGAISRNKSFDPDSGKFTCYVPGHYFFSINVKKIRGHHTLKLHLVKNGKVALRVESSSYTDTISATTILHLKRNDVLHLKLERRYSIDAMSLFTGYLLYAD